MPHTNPRCCQALQRGGPDTQRLAPLVCTVLAASKQWLATRGGGAAAAAEEAAQAAALWRNRCYRSVLSAAGGLLGAALQLHTRLPGVAAVEEAVTLQQQHKANHVT